jgi:hypothetical protein
MLTGGLTNRAVYADPDNIVTHTNILWEFNPVEVIARSRPAPFDVPIPGPELAAFAAAGVDVAGFQKYLRTHQLALIVSRDVTTRDKADHQQPFNLRVANTAHKTTGPSGKLYDIAWLQLFQGDQLRSLNFGNPNNARAGRRVIAQHLHDPAVENSAPANAPLASVPIAPDGSMAALVPARRAMSWQLTDTNGTGVVRERYWLTFAPGEIRSCTSCHGINQVNQANMVAPTNTPLALIQLLSNWKTNVTIEAAAAMNQGSACAQVTFIRRPAESGVTYHVQESGDLQTWSDIASYAGSNIVLTAQATEVSRSGSPNEKVTVRDIGGGANHPPRFLRVNVTRP